MAKTTIDIPLSTLDTSRWKDSAAPGTFSTLTNVVHRQDGLFDRRSPWLPVGSTTPSYPEVVAEHKNGSGVIRTADSGFGYNRTTSAWTQIKSCDVIKSGAPGVPVDYYSTAHRASVRSDVLLANAEIRAANTNVIQSLHYGGYIWVIYSTETGSTAGSLYLAVFECDTDGGLGPCVRTSTLSFATNASQPRMCGLDERKTGGSQYVCVAYYDHLNARIQFSTIPVSNPSATPTSRATQVCDTSTGGPFWDMVSINFDTTESRVLFACQQETTSANGTSIVGWVSSTGKITGGLGSAITGNRGLAFCQSTQRGFSNSELMLSRGLLANGTGIARPGGASGNYISGLWHARISCSDYTVAPALVAGAANNVQVSTSTLVQRFTGAEVGYSAFLPVNTWIWWNEVGVAGVSTSTVAYSNWHSTGAAAVGTATPCLRQACMPIAQPVFRGDINSTEESVFIWLAYTGGNINNSTYPASADIQHVAFLCSYETMSAIAHVCHDQLPIATGTGGYHSGKAFGGTITFPGAGVCAGGGNWLGNTSHVRVAAEAGVSASARSVSFTVLGRESEIDRTGSPANTEACLITTDTYPALTYKCSRTARYNRSTIFPGSKITRYDNAAFSELGFSLRPEAPVLTIAAGGSLANGYYSVYVVFYRRDADGTLHKSAPSYVQTVQSAGGNKQFTVEIQPYAMSDTTYDQAEIYVTPMSATSPPTGAPTLQQTVTINNFTASTTITISSLVSAGEILYTYSGELPNDCTPMGDIVLFWNNRLWIAGGEHRKELRYSKEVDGDGSISFSDAFVIHTPGYFGDITGLCGVGDRLYIFKRSRIYVLGGDGPDNFGDGAYTTPDLFTENTGSIYPASIVLMDDGAAYADQTGIKQIDLGGNIIDIGEPLNGTFNDRSASVLPWGWRPVLPIAHKIPTEQATAWVFKNQALTTTTLLVYHDRKKKWSTWTLPEAYGGTNEVWIESFGKWTWIASRKATDSNKTIARYYSESDLAEEWTATATDITTTWGLNRLYLAGPGAYAQIHEVAIRFADTADAGGASPTITLTMKTAVDGDAYSGTTKTVTIAAASGRRDYQEYRYIPHADIARCTWIELTISAAAAGGRLGLVGVTVTASGLGGGARLGTSLHMT